VIILPNKKYQKGYRFENRVKKFYEGLGYFVVRSAGSHSPADLIAIKTKHNKGIYPFVLLIQCKTDGKISPAERQKLVEIAKQTCTIPVIAYKPSPKKLDFKWVL